MLNVWVGIFLANWNVAIKVDSGKTNNFKGCLGRKNMFVLKVMSNIIANDRKILNEKKGNETKQGKRRDILKRKVIESKESHREIKEERGIEKGDEDEMNKKCNKINKI